MEHVEQLFCAPESFNFLVKKYHIRMKSATNKGLATNGSLESAESKWEMASPVRVFRPNLT